MLGEQYILLCKKMKHNILNNIANLKSIQVALKKILFCVSLGIRVLSRMIYTLLQKISNYARLVLSKIVFIVLSQYIGQCN